MALGDYCWPQEIERHLCNVSSASDPVVSPAESWGHVTWQETTTLPVTDACRGIQGTAAMVVQEKVREETVKWVWDRPLTFAEFLDMFGPEDQVELIDGVVVERSMVQLDHEKLRAWLDRVLGLYVEERSLGTVLG